MTNEDNKYAAIISEFENSSTHIGMYAFYDLEAKTYDVPFFAKSDLFAKRHFKIRASNPDNILSQFREHMELIRLGYFCLKDGDFEPMFDKIYSGAQFNLEENKK